MIALQFRAQSVLAKRKFHALQELKKGRPLYLGDVLNTVNLQIENVLEKTEQKYLEHGLPIKNHSNKTEKKNRRRRRRNNVLYVVVQTCILFYVDLTVSNCLHVFLNPMTA